MGIKALQEKQAKLKRDLKGVYDGAIAEDRGINAAEEKQVADIRGALAENECKLETARAAQDLDREMRAVDDANVAAAGAASERAGIAPQPTETATPKFSGLGTFLQAVARAGITNGIQLDDRLRHQAAVTGMGESVPSEGGFLVGVDETVELLVGAFTTGILSSRCRRTPIGPGKNGIRRMRLKEESRENGSRNGGMLAYWAGEADSVTASKLKWEPHEMRLTELRGLCYATDELLEDAVALEADIRSAFAEEFGFKLDDGIFRGTGAGQPLGVLNAPCLVSITKETGQKADTILAENIEKMYARVPAPSLFRSEWFVNQDCWPQIFSLHKVIGVGGVPMFVPAGGINQAPAGTLLGRPIVPIEHAESVGTKGDITLGDFNQYELIEKGGVKAATSIHVKFVEAETAFRFIVRINGQPRWSTAKTPYKGSATISPFVMLNSRD